ncbi:PA and RING finger domain-containing protein [Erysiphe neolycopersici]|uniref:PA and RING finger domain-containing protein n=1 Tax=Erysiphe neolycopersici TaxID=212602 RepID=A0A420HRQ9_9PEZI|nr:PA and RING finger domain-containing protein [Erysiphe neolycopersici]
MRPPQVIIAVTFSLIALLTIFSSRSPQSSQLSSLPSDSASSGTHAFFSFHAPFSLFPPSALISLTHDNKTAFLARPAAFGPSILRQGLSGQVWVGGGFDGIASSGELGCSDVQGWSTSYANPHYVSSDWDILSERSLKSNSKIKSSGQTRREDESYKLSSVKSKSWIDNFIRTKHATDDYPIRLLTTTNSPNINERKSTESNESHSDIQSIQEAAEIAGKVVLLNRGGCGFLEKVKWSQRRGAVALIVGANTKGGPLVEMYAKGDTFNITIPSVFTSYTTAKLLYNLAISKKSYGDKSGGGDMKLNSNSKKHKKSIMHNSKKPHGSSNDLNLLVEGKMSSSHSDKIDLAKATEKSGWFGSLFSSSNNMNSKLDQSRPPSSGQLDWILVDDRKVEDGTSSETNSEKKEKLIDLKKISTLKKSKMIRKPFLQRDVPDDDFLIGIQDWRDPDLVENYKAKKIIEPSKDSPSSSSSTLGLEDEHELPITHRYSFGALVGTPEHVSSLKGGSITPNSGEYTLEYREKNSKRESNEISRTHQKDRSNVHTATVFGNKREKIGTNPQIKEYIVDQDEKYQQDDERHEGLWVTLSSSNGASPFLDTLLVLVVSPLVTLTIVYVLLLIRSRYRQQKWRAPKSVVERLPVRTYQRMNISGANSLQLPNCTSLSVATPLLQGIPKPYSTLQTANKISESSGLLCESSQKQSRNNKHRDTGYENITSKLGTFKNQTETQTECVVCLEEYIEGVSRIMALPCGHEFHVECITPWLTTRRRTCPMCKGDVVRSLARASRYDTFQDNNIDEEYNYAHLSQRMTHILSSSGTPTNNQLRSDLELGRSIEVNHEIEEAGETNGWRGLFMGRIMTILRRVHSTREDRDR